MDCSYAVSEPVPIVRSSELIMFLHFSRLLPYWRASMLYIRAIPAIPTALLSDNIMFTDVLGRKMILTYSDFRHWPVFEARLRMAFEGCPGESRVRRNRYYLLDARGKILSPDNWADDIAPHSQITMSVVIHRGHTQASMCSACGQRLSPGNPASPLSPQVW